MCKLTGFSPIYRQTTKQKIKCSLLRGEKLFKDNKQDYNLITNRGVVQFSMEHEISLYSHPQLFRFLFTNYISSHQIWPDYLHKYSKKNYSIHILKYDTQVKALVLSKRLYYFHKANLGSLKLSSNRESQIRSLKVSLQQKRH